MWDKLPRSVSKVIILQRRDSLARYVSSVVAEKRRKWQVPKNGKVRAVPPFSLDPVQCMHSIARHAHLDKSRQQLFEELPTHLLHYEDLCEDIQGQMDAVFTFLDQTPVPVSPTEKKVGLPLKEQVLNLGEVLARFRA